VPQGARLRRLRSDCSTKTPRRATT
jgi:hypothetical protein